MIPHPITAEKRNKENPESKKSGIKTKEVHYE
jgi:hypothetical protein